MKVVVKNSFGIISSAFYEKCTDLTSILVINTAERWRDYDFTSCHNNSIIFAYHSNKMNCWDEDTVTITAETAKDEKILDRCRFYQQEKEQLLVLFIDDSLIGG